jgi:ABC-type transport system involved in cytochrome c biogenesis permease component
LDKKIKIKIYFEIMKKLTTQPSKNFFKRCWQGSARLWQAFWLVGVLGMLLVVTVGFLGSFMLMGAFQSDALVGVLLLPLLLGYLVFASVSVWRCSHNTNHSTWGVVARIIVVIVVLVWGLAAWQTFLQ